MQSPLFKLVSRLRAKRLKMRFPIMSEVFGVDYAEHAGALAQSAVGDPLQLVHTPTKNHPHNVFVYSIELNRILGYLPKTLAKELKYVFGKGFCLDGEICEIVFEDGLWHSRVLVYDKAELMKERFSALPYLHGSER